MAVNRSTRDVFTLVAAIMAALIVIIVNQLADRSFKRWDLTSEQKYSFSQGFLNIINKLEGPLKITYYISDKPPEQFAASKRGILDKLNDIKVAGNGRVMLEIIDPASDIELKKTLEKNGVATDVFVADNDKKTRQRMYSGIKLTYLDRPAEWIPAVYYPEIIDYQLANHIVSMTLTKETRPVIAFNLPKSDMPFNPQTRQRQPGGFDWLSYARFYGDKFDLRTVDLTELSPIPDKTKLLILVRPTDLNERQKYEVTKYLAEGGKILLVTNPNKVELGSNQTTKTKTGLEVFLSDIGVKINSDLLCDSNCVQLPVSVDVEKGVQYESVPVFVEIQPQNVNQTSSITRLLPTLVMPLVTEIALDNAKITSAGLNSEVLASTSAQTWSYPAPEGILAFELIPKTSDKPIGSKPTFVQLNGQFPFPYEQRVIPDWPKPEGDEKKKTDKEPEQKVGKATKAPGMLLIWSAPESFHQAILSDRQLGEQFRGNMNVIPNILETCALGDDLISIRSKAYETRTIDRMETQPRTRSYIKIALYLGVVVLALIYWLIRSSLRRSAQLRYERTYARTSGPSSFTP